MKCKGKKLLKFTMDRVKNEQCIPVKDMVRVVKDLEFWFREKKEVYVCTSKTFNIVIEEYLRELKKLKIYRLTDESRTLYKVVEQLLNEKLYFYGTRSIMNIFFIEMNYLHCNLIMVTILSM